MARANNIFKTIVRAPPRAPESQRRRARPRAVLRPDGVPATGRVRRFGAPLGGLWHERRPNSRCRGARAASRDKSVIGGCRARRHRGVVRRDSGAVDSGAVDSGCGDSGTRGGRHRDSRNDIPPARRRVVAKGRRGGYTGAGIRSVNRGWRTGSGPRWRSDARQKDHASLLNSLTISWRMRRKLAVSAHRRGRAGAGNAAGPESRSGRRPSSPARASRAGRPVGGRAGAGGAQRPRRCAGRASGIAAAHDRQAQGARR